MDINKIHSLFSIVFFFFASFLFISILSTTFINNFDNLLLILFKQEGLFFYLNRILLFISFLIGIYMYAICNKNNIKRNRFIFLGAALFGALIIISILLNPKIGEIEEITEIKNYEAFSLKIKGIIVNSALFMYFIATPLFNYFYAKKIYNSYFYKTYLKEMIPSLNTSIVFLFAYCIQIYNNKLYIFDIVLISSVIILFMWIFISSKQILTFHNVFNLFILIIGFTIISLSKNTLSNVNSYHANMFFNILGLFLWYLNISNKLDSK